MHYLCAMKNNISHTLIILGCLYLCTFMSAVSAQEKNDSMKISKSFLKELENAFSFENERMQSAPINTLKPQELNREFLQELVGPVNLSPGVSSLNIPGLSSKDLLKESYLWKHGQYGILKNGAITGLDVNALGSYLRPEEIRIRTMREIADKARKTMDKYYPMSGLPVYGTKDTVVLVKKDK